MLYLCSAVMQPTMGKLSTVFGLRLGGVLVGAFSWRAIFAVNIPLALITITFTLLAGGQG